MSVSKNLAAVISSHAVKQDSEVTSGKHEATTARSGHRRSLALARSACPGYLHFSHSASRPNNSPDVPLIAAGNASPSNPAENGYKFPCAVDAFGGTVGTLFNTVRI